MSLRFRSHRARLAFAAAALAVVAACLDVVQPSEVNVVVTIADVPTSATLHVELTDEDGNVAQKDPPSAPTVTVSFAKVKAGSIRVTAVARDAGGAAVQFARELRATATAARQSFHMSFKDEPPDAGELPDAGEIPDAGGGPDAGEVPDAGEAPDAGTTCVDFDPQGYGCPQPLTTVSTPPTALVGLGATDLPAVLAFPEAPGTAVLLRSSGELPVADRVQPAGVIVAPDGLSALLPSGEPSSYRVSLLRVVDGTVIDVAGQVLPGHFGFLADGTAWALDGIDPSGFGRLVVVRPGEAAATTDPACEVKARGPISAVAGSSTRTAVFEQIGVEPILKLGGRGACETVPLGLADDSAQQGTWSANPDASRLLYYSRNQATWVTLLGRRPTLQPPPPAPADGASFLYEDGSFLASSAIGILLFTPTSAGYVLATGELSNVAEFLGDQRQPWVVARGIDLRLGFIVQGGSASVGTGLNLAAAPTAGSSGGTRLVAWDAQGSAPNASVVFLMRPPDAPRKLGDGPFGAARAWVPPVGEMLVVQYANALVDVLADKALVDVAAGFNWDVTPAGLAYVDPSGRARLLSTPGATPAGITPDPATAVTGVRGDGESFYVARKSGDVVRVHAPRGVTP